MFYNFGIIILQSFKIYRRLAFFAWDLRAVFMSKYTLTSSLNVTSRSLFKLSTHSVTQPSYLLSFDSPGELRILWSGECVG
jgi:hypothetical protein